MNIDSSNLPNWQGPVGVKADGGGSIRGQGRVGSMRVHRAVHNKRLDGEQQVFGQPSCTLTHCAVTPSKQLALPRAATAALCPLHVCAFNGSLLCPPELVQLVDAGADVNEVEAAGNTPLHSAAFEGWLEGAQLLLQLGAKVNASNNAGDTPWVSVAVCHSSTSRVPRQQRARSRHAVHGLLRVSCLSGSSRAPRAARAMKHAMRGDNSHAAHPVCRGAVAAPAETPAVRLVRCSPAPGCCAALGRQHGPH